jgi:hypothetical protein
MLLIKPKIAKIVDECMQPHLETIQHNKDALILQEIQIKNQNDQRKPPSGHTSLTNFIT